MKVSIHWHKIQSRKALRGQRPRNVKSEVRHPGHLCVSSIQFLLIIYCPIIRSGRYGIIGGEGPYGRIFKEINDDRRESELVQSPIKDELSL